MQLKEVQRELNRFGKFVVQQARSRLTKGIKKGNKKFSQNDTKKLYNSIKFKPYTSKDFTLGVKIFEMEDYGKFQDQGVKGTKSNYIENKKSPFIIVLKCQILKYLRVI